MQQNRPDFINDSDEASGNIGGTPLPAVSIETSSLKSSITINFARSVIFSEHCPQSLNSILATIDDWTSFCIASIEHMPKLALIGHFALEDQVKSEIIDFLEENSDRKEISKNPDDDLEKITFYIGDRDLKRVSSRLEKTMQWIKASQAVQRSNISALIAEFDFLLFRILREISKEFPDEFLDKEETIPVKHFQSGGTFEEWKDEKIQQKIDKMLRRSHQHTIEWMLTEIGSLQDISKVRQSPFFKDFLEICQRRHLLVHNGGEVNRSYIDNCLKAGFKDEDLPSLHDQLDLSQNYMKRSAARVYLIGLFTTALLAQNKFPSHKHVIYQALLTVSHDFLIAGMTKMARRVIDFAEHNKRQFDNEIRLKFGINRALTYLYDPDLDPEAQLEEAKNALKEYDFSVVNPIFRLALSCIKRDFSSLEEQAKSAYNAGLTYSDASHFAVFKEAREKQSFMEHFL